MAKTRKHNPESLLRSDIRRLDVLIKKARAVHDEASHANARVGAIRTEAELVQRRRSVVLALASLLADHPGEALRALRASAAADRSFKAASDLHAAETKALAPVSEETVDLETAYASLDLPTRRWLQRRLDEDLARSTG